MYIAPNSVVRILRNCPLDNTYDHTIYFSSASAQATYFQSLTAYTHTNLSYNRVNRGQLKIQRKAEDMYNCNYMMFQNTSFGDRWFYAFITSIEYVSNEVSLITFEIDVMQTWFFDVTLEQCFVEREHVMNDTIGANLQPEPVDLGEYVYNSFSDSGYCETPCAVVMSNVGSSGQEVKPTFAANTLHGTAYAPYSVTESGQEAVREDLSDVLTSWDEMNESITAVFMYYAEFMDNDVITMTRGASYTVTKSKNYSNLNGYAPKNNKLFTYPYNYMLVTTDEGDSIDMRYEYFSTSNCQFVMAGSVAANPQISLQPLNYKGCSFLRNEQLILSGFPQCTFNIDAFKSINVVWFDAIDRFGCGCRWLTGCRSWCRYCIVRYSYRRRFSRCKSARSKRNISIGCKLFTGKKRFLFLSRNYNSRFCRKNRQFFRRIRICSQRAQSP